MRRLTSLAATTLIAAATLLGGCEYNWSYSNDFGIGSNELTRAAEPVVEAWKSGRNFSKLGNGLESVRPESVTWTKMAKRSNGLSSSGEIFGKARLSDGRSIDLTATLARDGDTWTVVAIRSKTPIAAPPAAAPSNAEAALVHETMQVVIASIRAKDFKALHAHSASVLQKSVTVAAVNERMKGFFAVTVTGDPLAGRTPVFTSMPVVGKADQMQLDGHYDLGPNLLRFSLTYTPENGAWKLIGWNIKIDPVAKA
jgi:hypothetical protein